MVIRSDKISVLGQADVVTRCDKIPLLGQGDGDYK